MSAAYQEEQETNMSTDTKETTPRWERIDLSEYATTAKRN
jgi:hypothetical protein